MKQVKLTLKDDPIYIIFGLVSSENEVKFPWLINNELGINLTRTENLTLQNKLSVCDISLFQYENRQAIKYTLLSNKPNPCRLFEEFKNIDYLLVLSGDINEELHNQIKQQLKSISSISTILEIPLSSFKKKEIFIYF